MTERDIGQVWWITEEEEQDAPAVLSEGEVDIVNRPPHYAAGVVECIDAMASSMTTEAFRGYLKGNVIKYLWRYEKKNGLEDLRKALWYLKYLIASQNEA